MAKKAYVGVDGVARKVKKIYIGVGGSVQYTLPSGYTQMGYIAATGTQYIDTGFKPNQNTRVVVDFQVENTNVHVFGSRTAFTDTEFVLFWASNSDFCVQMNNSVFNGGSFDTAARHTVEMTSTTMKMDAATKATYSVGAFQCAYNMYLFSCPNSSESENVKGKIFSCKVYDGDNLIRDLVPCTNASGIAGMYDAVNGVFYPNAGTGTFATGPIDKGTARMVKKGYVGVGGVARLFWAGGELVYYGTLTDLTYAREYLAGASAGGNYALFAGGSTSGRTSFRNNVEAYNKSKVKSNATNLSATRDRLAGASVGNYALFVGGYTQAKPYHDVVDSYDASLTKGSPAVLSTARYQLAGGSVGDFALFAGGRSSNSPYITAVVEAYNSSLTKTSVSSLTTAVYGQSVAQLKDYVLFAGGWPKLDQGNSVATVCAYNKSLTKSSPSGLNTSANQEGTRGAFTPDYAIIANYAPDSSTTSLLTVYSQSLTKLSGSRSLSLSRNVFGSGSIDGYALFAGGATTGSFFSTTYEKVVDVFDNSLTMRSDIGELNEARSNMESANVGDFLLFAGGYNGSSESKKVDAYAIM